MIWSKIWLFLVCLVAAAAIALLLVERKPLQGELDIQAAGRLEGADRSTGLLLKVHARKWLDAAAQASADAELSEALEQASRGEGNLDLLRRTVQTRLRTFNAEWKADSLIAVDGKGRVIARAGRGEDEWGDDLSGAPLVAEALRGYRLDDTWDDEGRLMRMCASPVIARDRYVGAFVIGQAMGTDLATRIRDTFGVDAVFVSGGQVVAQSNSLSILGDLPRLVMERSSEIAERGRTTVVTLPAGDRSYLAVAAPIAGSAVTNGAAYVLVAERPIIATIGGVIASLSAVTLDVHRLGWIGGGLIAALLVGLLLMGLEHDRPGARLLMDLQAMTRGEMESLDDRRHRSRFGRMARAVNALLTPKRSDETVRFATQARAPIEVPAAPPVMPKRTPVMAPNPPPLPIVERPAATAPLDAMPAAPLPPTPHAPRTLRPRLSPLPSIAGGWATLGTTPSPQPRGAQSEPHPAEDNTPISTPSARRHEEDPTLPLMALASERTEAGNPVEVEIAAAGSPDPELVEIFEEFLATKRRCGELTDGITYEKFAEKLQQNRAQLIARYACRSVKFHVYVKDGRAALKATPLAG